MALVGRAGVADKPGAYGQNARLTYSEYLKVQELLQLQQEQSDPPVHDELQFIVVHQVYELWFKLILHELDAITAAVASTPANTPAGAGSGDEAFRTAARLGRRIVSILHVLVGQIHVLESMRPVDFLAFRSKLNPASGFQSAQFREVELVLGFKEPALMKRLATDSSAAAAVKRFAQPSLPEVLYAALRRRGLDVTPPGSARSEAQAHATLQALRTVYEQPDRHSALYELCETLLDIDEQITLWRRHHVMMVERQIGAKAGTGQGTTGELDGIRYLQTTLDKRALPDLWAVRTVLEG
jgi:tryptophan 2,3-dioxygenase